MIREDALSPVVAFMLLLMVIVSFISLLNAYYIPSLKQQSEITHLQQTEQGMLAISSDIDRMISFKQDATIKERFPLGGGDVIFSPVRSSGTIQISPESWILNITFTNESSYSTTFNITAPSISYHPVGNFWVNQGYTWNKGIINITKNKRTTWLEYIDTKNATQGENQFIQILATPVTVTKAFLSENNTLANITVSATNITPDSEHAFVSSNGMGNIGLTMSTYQELIVNVTSLQIVVNSNLPKEQFDEVNKMIENWVISSFTCSNCVSTTNLPEYKIAFHDYPVNFTLQEKMLKISTI
ncbi:MAG: hypothetical protein LUQ50_00815 [Methanospirillum sp.]|uniref:hypothetical protein n=1 Tax=Methanospirillum sp. TaxID=45200 RepID=UPI00236DB697|nr:hypothetical protein [Methanospirillum sp.]MDD1727593.1 hypothetical protein [Methanospirillum sp.]